MKRTAILSLIVFAGCIMPACINAAKPIQASKNYISKVLPAPGEIEVIELIGSPDIDYYVSEDGATALSVYGSDNVLDLLEVTVSGKKLTVKYRDGVNGTNNGMASEQERVNIQGNPKLKVTVVASGELRSATVTGSGDVELKGSISGKELRVAVAGSGDIEAERLEYETITAEVIGSGDISLKWIEATRVTATVKGSGDVESAGRTIEAQYSVTGSGDVDAERLEADQVKATLSGSGDIKCWVNTVLNATVFGSGAVRYKGDPGTVETSSSKGSVRPM